MTVSGSPQATRDRWPAIQGLDSAAAVPIFGAMSASRELQRQLKRLELCLPRAAKTPPAGPGWLHEIKHDGFRILAERDAAGVTLHTRRGYDFGAPAPGGPAFARPPSPWWSPSIERWCAQTVLKA